jgi:hypothetical protein
MGSVCGMSQSSATLIASGLSPAGPPAVGLSLKTLQIGRGSRNLPVFLKEIGVSVRRAKVSIFSECGSHPATIVQPVAIGAATEDGQKVSGTEKEKAIESRSGTVG